MSIIITKNLLLNQLSGCKKRINFSLQTGELLKVVGKNGSGKTTLLHTLLGLKPAQDGFYHIESQAPLGCVLHLLGMHPSLTVLDNWCLYRKMMKKHLNADRDEIKKYAVIFNIEHVMHCYPSTLSAGELQKSKLVQLLLGDHAVWLLDEPASHLDTQSIDAFKRLMIQHLKKPKSAIVLVQHQNTIPMLSSKNLTLSAS